MSCDGIVVVLGLDRASVPGSFAAIADKGSLCDAYAILFLKARTHTVTSQAGLTVDVAYLDLPAGVHLLAMEAVNTEVVRIDVAAFVIGINATIEHNLFGDRRRILAEILGYLPKRLVLVQRLLDVLAIFQGKVFVVSRYQI